MPKLPYMQFYCSDYQSDTALLSLASRGLWIEILCYLHNDGRSGIISGTAAELSRLGRCSTSEFIKALKEIADREIADIKIEKGIYTIQCRRMVREAHERKLAEVRQKRFKNAETTPEQRENNEETTGDISESDLKKKNLTKKEGFEKLLTNLTEKEVEWWNSWLEVWEYAHGKGKAMHPSVKEAQLRFLLTIPSEFRLEAIKSAHKGQWKNINDPRKKPDSQQTKVLPQLSSNHVQSDFSHEERGVAV